MSALELRQVSKVYGQDAADGRIKRAALEPPIAARDDLPKLKRKTGVTR